MASPGRGGARRGADFERKVAGFMCDQWGLQVQRTVAGRSTDPGDLVWPGMPDVHIDCKSRDSIPLSMFDAVELDADSQGHVPVMVVDRPGVGDAGRAFVVVRLVDAGPLFDV